MKLWAISDLHIGYPKNREALNDLPDFPDDWLILAGDIGETPDQLEWLLDLMGERFEKLIWVPGNHELFTMPRAEPILKGEARYNHFIEVCQKRGVLTPEDEFILWPGSESPIRIVPLFLGYDYSFCPEGMTPAEAKEWAAQEGIVATDEHLVFSDPHATKEAWCAHRVELTLERLRKLPTGEEWVLINHYPLRQELVRLFRIPRYSPWCGTTLTEDWHRAFPIKVAVSGHLHMRATDWRDGVRFEEVSIGYPDHWIQSKGIVNYLREILPGPAQKVLENAGPFWHR